MTGSESKNNKVDDEIQEQPTPGCYVKARYVLAFMGFLGMFNVYSLRTNLSVAIVAMVNSTDDSGNESDTCPDRGQSAGNSTNSNGIYDWNSAEQGLLLGCYFYGYIVSNIPGAWLSKRYGFKIVLGSAMFFSSIITLFTPLAANSSFELLVALRVILGFFQGVSFPSMQGAWSYWAPPMERSALVSVHISGSSFGTCVTLPIAGVIADTLGWEAVFYFTGGVSLLWTLVWFAIIYNKPSEHPRISDEEKAYITESIGIEKQKVEGVKVRTPWKSMLTSLPILAIICGHFASNWGNYTLLTMLPTYLSSILKFDLTASGALSSLPYILQWIFTFFGGMATDVIRKNNVTSTVAIRKINTTLGLAVPALFIVLAGYIGCNATAAIAFFTMSVAFNALTVPGCKANTIDIAPKYGGIVYGISNTVANISGFLAPQVVGLLLLDGNNLGQWQLVFWISAAFYLFGAVMYLIFGSGVEQSWAKGHVLKGKILGEDSETSTNL
ncbi:sialin-like isoform X1 [Clavelina lepadiformis]|uniref:sialin-like isoform X1 n=1 Tax=Clavelina lepadiformis TaxID=159417 RepID=UPI004041C058